MLALSRYMTVNVLLQKLYVEMTTKKVMKNVMMGTILMMMDVVVRVSSIQQVRVVPVEIRASSNPSVPQILPVMSVQRLPMTLRVSMITGTAKE
jgi:hypothetical protein